MKKKERLGRKGRRRRKEEEEGGGRGLGGVIVDVVRVEVVVAMAVGLVWVQRGFVSACPKTIRRDRRMGVGVGIGVWAGIECYNFR